MVSAGIDGMRTPLRTVEIASDRTYQFPLARAALWRLVTKLDHYPRWWPWIRHFDAELLAPGEVWSCTIRPPLPYALHCWLVIGTVTEGELVEANLNGDLSGTARIELRDAEPRENGAAEVATEVRLVTNLAAASPPIKLATRAFPAVARWGHEWVLDTAARQFRAAALDS